MVMTTVARYTGSGSMTFLFPPAEAGVYWLLPATRAAVSCRRQREEIAPGFSRGKAMSRRIEPA